MKSSLLGLHATTHKPHPLHSASRAWVETNCFVDLFIEVLAAWGLDPHACLPFTFAVDFEGDQWLFFKPKAAELTALYGLDIEELTIWKSLEEHAVAQARRGRMVLVEVDAHFLPDTAGSTYRTGHSKTTIGIESIDPIERHLGYFHNAGYFELSADDYAGVFGLSGAPPLLPPYAEFVKLDRIVHRKTPELVAMSTAFLGTHLARRPEANPVKAYAEVFERDVAWLATQPSTTFHEYSFATLRQLGAAFELAGSYLLWLELHGETGLSRAIEQTEKISNGAKSLQFQVARAAMRKKPFDATEQLAALAEAYDVATGELDARYRR